MGKFRRNSEVIQVCPLSRTSVTTERSEVRKKQGIVLLIEQEIDAFLHKGGKFKSSTPVEIREIVVPVSASPSSEKMRKQGHLYQDCTNSHFAHKCGKRAL